MQTHPGTAGGYTKELGVEVQSQQKVKATKLTDAGHSSKILLLRH
jgi:hypothetical protein